MSIPIFDKIVHRAYAVFGGVNLINKKLYNLKAKINLFYDSAEGVKLKIPFSKE